MRPLMVEAVPLFERASGNTADVQYRLTSVLTKEVEDGAAFDIALMPRPELDALVRAGKIAAGSETDMTRSAVGVAVRAGAAKPDIATVDAFKRTLRQARTIAYSDGPSGLYIASLLDRLGLAEDMKAKTKLTTGPVAELVANGVGRDRPAADRCYPAGQRRRTAGPLPNELQSTIVYAAGLSARSPNAAAARAFVAFMATPAIAHIIRAKGMEPG